MSNGLVLAITPISYTENSKSRIITDDILLIELYDTLENIFPGLYLVAEMIISIQMMNTR